MVKDLTQTFSQARFSTRVATNMQYDQHTQFNESNITTYLAELEEHFSSLITYQAYQSGDPHAAISTIPLEHLEEKHYARTDVNIDPPGDSSTNAEIEDESGMQHPFETKDFYMKAVDLIENGNVSQDRKEPSGKL
jgi:hypothetical protein